MLRLDWNLVFTIINLIVLYLLLKKFLITPVTAIMEKRKALIEDGLANADQSQKEALELKGKYENALENSKEESSKIIEQARKEAKEEYNQKIEKAEEDSRRILENAQKTAEVEKAQALRSVESQIASLAMAAAAKIVTEQSTDRVNGDVYDQFLKKAGDAHESTNNA